MWTTVAVLTLLGVALGYLVAQRGKILRALRKAAVTRVCDVKDGTGRVTGRLGFVREPLLAPLTGRRCAYYEVLVEQQGSKGGWRTLVQETAGQDFSIRDDTGKAFIHLDSPLVAVVLDAHFRSGFGADAAPHLEAFLARHGASSTGLIFNKALRYREGVLEEGELVAVLGHASWEIDPEPDAESVSGGYRDAPRRLVFSSSDAVKLHVSDDPSVLKAP